jgi:hypothetical protein
VERSRSNTRCHLHRKLRIFAPFGLTVLGMHAVRRIPTWLSIGLIDALIASPVSLVVAGLGLAATGCGVARCVVDGIDPVVHLAGLMRSLPDRWLGVVARSRPASR